MDFDQDVAAWWIKQFLVDHKISLIGQEISVGGIYIAPLFFYFLSIFYFVFRMDPLAANIAVSLISVITMVLIYKVAKLLFDEKVAVIALIIYAFSFQINFYDRTTAPSNLIMLLSLTVLYLLLNKKGLLLGPVLGLTLSVSPAAMVLIPQSLFFHFKKKFIILAIIVLFAFPLIFFDIRHNFMVTKRIFQLIFSGQAKNENYFLPTKLITNIITLVQSFRQQILPLIIYNDFVNALLNLATTIVITISFIKSGFSAFQRKILFVWILVPLAFFTLYPFHVPEYYFLSTFPVAIIFFAAFLSRIDFRIMTLIITAFMLTNTWQIVSNKYDFSMYYKKQAIKYIIDKSGGQPFKVNYNIVAGQDNGFKYLFYWSGHEPSIQAKEEYIITVPSYIDDVPGEVFGKIKVTTKNE
ncbi:glycosyltransferase family 39 protein [Patescibacteria group bacterium]|nr:glycosyltransferase family 39 protein [Patescibacteria group bacterium]